MTTEPRWRAWWFAPADPRTAAAVRIAFAVACLFSLWDLGPDLDLLLGRTGAFGTLDAPTFEPTPIFGFLFAHDSPTELRVWFGLSIAAATCAAIGLASRWTVAFAYVLMLLGQERNPYALSAADTILRQVGLWVLLLDTSAAWSMDSLVRQRRGRPRRTEIAGWPLRGIFLQTVAIYWSGLVFKLATEEWRSGAALGLALRAPYMGNANGHVLAGHPLLVECLTYGALLCEFMIPVLLAMRPTHRLGIALGLSLHLGIDLFMNLRGFTLAMSLCFLAALDRDDWAAVSRVSRIRR